MVVVVVVRDNDGAAPAFHCANRPLRCCASLSIISYSGMAIAAAEPPKLAPLLVHNNKTSRDDDGTRRRSSSALIYTIHHHQPGTRPPCIIIIIFDDYFTLMTALSPFHPFLRVHFFFLLLLFAFRLRNN